MIIKDDIALLYIEPQNDRSNEPIIDHLTIKMFNLLITSWENPVNRGTLMGNNKARQFVSGIGTMGHHNCRCGAASECYDYLLNGTLVTNTLCVHYLAYHRDEVPQSEINKLEKLDSSTKLEENSEKLFHKLLLNVA